MRSFQWPIIGAFLITISCLPSSAFAQSAAAPPPTVTPADCGHPTPPVQLTTRIICSAITMARLSQRVDESARALRLSIAPDERVRFDEDQAAWFAGAGTACQADGDGQVDAAHEIAARDCLLARFTNRLSAMRHMVGTWRAAAMRDCANTARALHRAVHAA